VHHHLKNHPYRHIVARLRQCDDTYTTTSGVEQKDAIECDELEHDEVEDDGVFSKAQPLPPHLLLLGLTASVTYAVNPTSIKKAMSRLARELEIKSFASATKEELQEAGYHANVAVAEVILPEVEDLGFVPRGERKPHQMLTTFVQRVQRATATVAAMMLHTMTTAVEKHILSDLGDTNLEHFRVKYAVSLWGTKVAKRLNSERNHLSQELKQALTLLLHMYEAMRIAIVSWEEHAAEASVLYLQIYAKTATTTALMHKISPVFREYFARFHKF